jgi:hypothetical protein
VENRKINWEMERVSLPIPEKYQYAKEIKIKAKRVREKGNTCNGIVEAPGNTHLLWHTI